MNAWRQKVNYEVCDGDKVIASGSAYELSYIMDCETKRFNELAKSGGLLKRKYKVRSIGLRPCKDFVELDEKIKEQYVLGIKQARIARNLKVGVGKVAYRVKCMRERGEVA